MRETTLEAFNTMVNYFCKTLGGEKFKLNHIRCDPQKLFELLMPDPCKQVWDVKLVQDGLGSPQKCDCDKILGESMIFAATVAKSYNGMFEDVSRQPMMKCLKFPFDTASGGASFQVGNLDILRELVDVGNATLQLPEDVQLCI